jgi:hypothetical protein
VKTFDRETEVELFKDRLEWELEKSKIPTYMHPGIVEYVTKGRPVGDFLRNIFSNNLVKAAYHADHNNQRHLYDYATFVYAHIPVPACGSPEAFKRWRDVGGLAGYLAEIDEAATKNSETEEKI